MKIKKISIFISLMLFSFFIFTACVKGVVVNKLNITIDLPNDWTVESFDGFAGESPYAHVSNKDGKKVLIIQKVDEEFEEALALRESLGDTKLKEYHDKNISGVTLKTALENDAFLYHINLGVDTYKCQTINTYDGSYFEESMELCKSIR